jgi:hypothetical protein
MDEIFKFGPWEWIGLFLIAAGSAIMFLLWLVSSL